MNLSFLDFRIPKHLSPRQATKKLWSKHLDRLKTQLKRLVEAILNERFSDCYPLLLVGGATLEKTCLQVFWMAQSNKDQNYCFKKRCF